MQIYRYKLENNTLNSVSDCVSNKANTKKIRVERGRSYIRRKVWLIVMHCLHCSSILYILDYSISMVWLVYIVRV